MINQKRNLNIKIYEGVIVISRMFIPIFAILFAAAMISCNTVEEEPDYTYSIAEVFWSDSIDANQDGYVSFKRLNFNVHLAENVARKIEGRVYYKLNSASDYSFYKFSDETNVAGNNVDNLFFVSIGAPNRELVRGLYDFSIEIYEQGKDRLEAKTGSRDSLMLTSNAFEKSENDNNYSMTAWWEKAYDRDGNGYSRYANLIINIDNDANVTRHVTTEILYKLADSTNYLLYHTISDFTITGQEIQDTVSWQIAAAPNELEHGMYDFRINLYEAGKSNLIAFIDQEYPALKDVRFETSDEDSYYFSVDNVWWSDSIDVDTDSFTQLRKLHFDVNVDRNQTFPVFAKVFSRHPDSSDYEKYDSTAAFNVTGGNTDDVKSVFIGQSPAELDSAEYDFLISIYEDLPDSLQVVEIAVSAANYDALKSQAFETPTQDSTGVSPR